MWHSRPRLCSAAGGRKTQPRAAVLQLTKQSSWSRVKQMMTAAITRILAPVALGLLLAASPASRPAGPQPKPVPPQEWKDASGVMNLHLAAAIGDAQWAQE